MGHSQAEKAETHARIVDIAARRMREQGIGGVGIADLMQEAGLTVGGFYKHFSSRDALVTEAVAAAFGKTRDPVDGVPSAHFDRLIDDYLSKRHRDNPGTGCAVAALAPDLARSNEPTRALCTDRIARIFERLAISLDGKDAALARAQAILTFSALVGAVGLARAVSDEALSTEILETVRAQLKTSAQSKPRQRPEKDSPRRSRAAAET